MNVVSRPATPGGAGGPGGPWPLHVFRKSEKHCSETKEMLKNQCFGPTNYFWPLHFQTRVAGPVFYIYKYTMKMKVK